VRVLVVEDEIELAKLIRQGLMNDAHLADVAIRGEDALWMAAATPYTVICLDVNLPGIDGLETCRRLRAEGIATPILMLTARDGVDDRIAGLNTGADDYLVKPFAFARQPRRAELRPPGRGSRAPRRRRTPSGRRARRPSRSASRRAGA
jgi:two-component system OmpR family response regulator